MITESKKKQTAIFCIATLIIIPGLFWLSGYNFDKRELPLAMCALYTLMVMGFGATIINNI